MTSYLIRSIQTGSTIRHIYNSDNSTHSWLNYNFYSWIAFYIMIIVALVGSRKHIILFYCYYYYYYIYAEFSSGFKPSGK